ncbi:MAG: response regulator [Anaerolineae bacterium]|nr:response regulator [Anaerolineae bacterium]
MRSRYKALVIDDSRLTRRLCQGVLENQGLLVHTVETGQATFQALSNASYDVILLDIDLPDTDGLTVLAEVTAQYPQISPIMMTGYASLEAAIRAQELGAEGFILKPFNHAKLVQIVSRVLDRRQLREDYIQLQTSIQTEKLAALGRLTASLAHEINNPLQALRSGLRLLGRPHLDNAKRQHYVATLAQEVERLITITGQTLDFARPSQAGLQPTDLNQLLQSTLDLVNKQLQQKHIDINVTLAVELPIIRAVPGHIKQVLINLILNAIDAMAQGGLLSLTTTYLPDKQQGVITVQDTGEGMTADVMSKIFEPFFSTKDIGTGLGLSISYAIIEAHGGHIEVESTPDVGTLFSIYLPQSRTTGEPDEPA